MTGKILLSFVQGLVLLFKTFENVLLITLFGFARIEMKFVILKK